MSTVMGRVFGQDWADGLSRARRRERLCAAANYAIEPLERRTMLAANFTISTLVAFDGANGASPAAGLISDGGGNLWGTTQSGGSADEGTVFEIAARTRTLTTPVTFDGVNGTQPYGRLIEDAAGDFFGTTVNGGAIGDGTVFEIAAGTHVLTTLASFNGINGGQPFGGLLIDTAGNLFGTTAFGGAVGDGTVFEVVAGSGVVTTLATFNSSNGATPMGSLVADGSGNLFGTTSSGGGSGVGTIFEVVAGSFTVTTLATFNSSNGANPGGELLADGNGSFFGTTRAGGAGNMGTVFEYATASHTLSTLASFDGSDGADPQSGLIFDSNGNMFGTTSGGGANGQGTVFEVAATSQALSTVVSFNGANGAAPVGDLVVSGGNLTGTTSQGGANSNGTVFQLFPGATKVVFVQQPAGGMAGAVLTPAVVVQVEDANGNVVTDDSSSVTLSVASGPGILGGTTTVTAVNGVATFGDLTLPTAGTYALKAVDGSLTSATSSSFTIHAAPGPAAQVVFTTEPVGTTAGAVITPAVVVQVEDAMGNVVTGDGSNVTLSVASGPGALGGSTTVAAVNGVATFSNLTLSAAGTYALKAVDGSLTSATSASFKITAPVGPAAQVVFGQQPLSAQVSAILKPPVTVLVEDANGNVVTTDQSNVTVSVASGPGILVGSHTVSAVNGVATFSDLALPTAGNYTLQATDGVLTAATSASFTISNVSSLPAAQLAFGQQPTNVMLGAVMTPAVTVKIEDVFGNLVAGDNSNVTLNVATGPGMLGGTTTVAAVNGVATFSNLSLPAAGTYALTASDGGLTAATSVGFTVSAGAAAQLAFGPGPGQGFAGFALTPAMTVRVEDANGNVVATDQSNVTLSVASGPGTLGGTVTAAAVNGVATFTDVTLSAAGTYTLRATDGALTPATSGAFTISPVPGHVVVTAPDAGSTPLVKVFDAATGDLVFSFLAYSADFSGAVHVATGDINGDGVPDIVTATGAGGVPLVNVFDGRTGQMIGNFFSYSGNYIGGVEVAVADVTGSGHAQIITSTDAGGVPLVNVFDRAGTLLMNFFAYDPGYLGGVRIAAGDFGGNGPAEIVTATAGGGVPLINVFNGLGQLVGNLFGDDPSYTGGLEIAVGDFTGDGLAKIATYRDQATVSQVKLFNLGTQQLFRTVTLSDSTLAVPLGLRLAAVEPTGSSVADIVTVPTSGNAPEVEVFSSVDGTLVRKWMAYDPAVTVGLFVAAV